jgi:hypothetical protein
LVTPERATELAQETQYKIDFLKSIEQKVNNEENLTSEEDEKKKTLFGEKEFKKGFIGWEIDGLKTEQYQRATAGINGAEYVEVAFPTGMYHKESEFEKWMKEHEGLIKELYHYIGITLDKETESIISEYNRTIKQEEKIGWEGEVIHVQKWYSPEYIENEQEKALRFPFGGTEYRLKKHTDGNWYVSLERSGISLVPKNVNDKLNQLNHKTISWLQDKANQILR